MNLAADPAVLPPPSSSSDPSQALALGRGALERTAGPPGTNGLVLLGLLGASAVLPPIAVVVGCSALDVDVTYMAIAAVASVFVGPVALLALLSARRGPRIPKLPPGTLGFEAALTIEPLRARLERAVSELEVEPSLERAREVAFFAEQLDEIAAIADRRDASPGRGYVGFDVPTRAQSSWRRSA